MQQERFAAPSWLAQSVRRTFSGHRGRLLREHLTGYLMILPATVLVFIFGIFPVGFALFVSLHKWRLKRGAFIGLENYVRAIDNLAYLTAFGLALGALMAAVILVVRMVRRSSQTRGAFWPAVLPGALYAATAASFLRWTVLLLPQVLDIAGKIAGLEKTRQVFIGLLKEAFRAPTVIPAWYTFLGLFALSLLAFILMKRFWREPQALLFQAMSSLAWLSAATGVLLLWFTYQQVALAYQEAFLGGTDPGIWPQLVMISSGAILLGLAWFAWRAAMRAASRWGFWLRLVGALALMVGAWLLIGELPVVIAAGDKDLWQGLKVTVFYSLGTVPFQLSISLFLAILLFQKLRGSELFRMLFFLPYVTPTVASAAVFRQLFSNRPQAPANQLLIFLGLEPSQWLRDPHGIFTTLGQAIGLDLPGWAAGPSIALVVIMLYSIWTYVGYDTVIYLAGLGNISSELIEAAEIDGAGRWEVFRYIIFPLLSPTTYFLSLIAIIGTFKAFNHIWVMRQGSALGTTDTFSVVIFIEFFEKLRYGYASALAFVLFAVILLLTLVNNRLQGSRVFYG